MGHWTPTGIEPTDYDDDENYFRNMAFCFIYLYADILAWMKFG